MANDETHVIVVGVDGSEHAHRAMRWALAEAQQRQAKVVLIHAFTYGPIMASPYTPTAIDQFAEDAEVVLAHEVALAQQVAPGLAIEGRVECASPGHVLVDESRHAELVVVGSRGHSALTGALLGSVSSAVVRHAHCPVVVVPPADRVEADTDVA